MSSMLVVSNFDWSETDRELVIFIPNHGRKEYVDYTIQKISTVVKKNRWLIVVGNDGIDCNFSYLYNQNVRYFTLMPEVPGSRNGCFIRNYAIKRCKSRLFAQKDPEILIFDDYIHSILKYNAGWRAGKIVRIMSKELSNKVLQGGKRIFKPYYDILPSNPYFNEFSIQALHWNSYRNDPGYESIRSEVLFFIEVNAPSLYDGKLIQGQILYSNGVHNVSNYFSYVNCVETEVLQRINGYDEDYTSYGYEDTDLFCRLMAMNYPVESDPTIQAIHLHHDEVKAIGEPMFEVFARKSCLDTVRNVGRGWGEG